MKEAIATDGPPLSAVLTETFDGLIETIVATERILASTTALRAELVDQARVWSEIRATMSSDGRRQGGWDASTVARRELVTELACALRMPERSVENLIAQSSSLVHDLPATLAALKDGEIGYRHATALIDHADSLPDGEGLPVMRRAFEEAALPFAKTLTVAKFDRKARMLRERAHPETIAQRHAACVADRSIELSPGRDGMSWLTAYLPAAEAQGIYNRITDIAMGLRDERVLTDEERPRTLTQLRADVFAELLIDGTTDGSTDGPMGRLTEETAGAGSDATSDASAPALTDRLPIDRLPLGSGLRARVLVTVPVLTLLGTGDEPATLEGYGPIDPETARRLCAGAPSFTRILTHPETGTVLSVGRDRYAVPADLRTWLRIRDETCRYPGCGRGASRCDLDHSLDWQYGGLTAHGNLAHLCRAHHRLKHHTGWTVDPPDDGRLTWTSPTGRRYTTEPATRMRAAPEFE
ncbi:MAG TPA: DUF222 domain-containing protein [Lacisediminihabitans sp.]|uniref:HNH endonuclease signature motif containing protein n=1 Tax=Lacisediminihabitans sp. TaxID=2787631 RepID=UPI002EDAEDC7